MKKFLAMVLGAIMMFVFWGCSDTVESSSEMSGVEEKSQMESALEETSSLAATEPSADGEESANLAVQNFVEDIMLDGKEKISVNLDAEPNWDLYNDKEFEKTNDASTKFIVMVAAGYWEEFYSGKVAYMEGEEERIADFFVTDYEGVYTGLLIDEVTGEQSVYEYTHGVTNASDHKSSGSSTSVKDEVHDWMKEQADGKDYSQNDGGEYYCMGKGDTCNNKTYNAYDLYCSACDPDGDNKEG